MMQPQDIQTRKMMELLEGLHLSEKEMLAAQDYLTGAEGEAILERISFHDLSSLPDGTKDDFRTTFRKMINRGRKEAAQKLFAVVFTVGRSTMSSLFPEDLLSYANKNVEGVFPADQALSLMAEHTGENVHWIRTYMMERMKKLALLDAANVRKAMGHHKSSPDNGLLILYTIYFWMCYPDSRYRPDAALQGREKTGILQSMSRLFAQGGSGPLYQVRESDRALLKAYEDLIVDSLENLFTGRTEEKDLALMTNAVNHDQMTEQVRERAGRQNVSNFLMKLLCGCAFANFTLSLRLKNFVSLALAANVKGALSAMEEMDLRYDLHGRGGSFDVYFGIGTADYIRWAASRKNKRLLAYQFGANREAYLACYREADLAASALMLEIIREQDKQLHEQLLKSGQEAWRKQLADVIFPDDVPIRGEVRDYLLGQSSLAGLYQIESQFKTVSHYVGSAEYRALEPYVSSYGQDGFFRRCLIVLICREAAYVFHYLLMRGDAAGEDVREVYAMLEQEKLDMAHQLKVCALLYDLPFSTRLRSVVEKETEAVFHTYMQTHREELLQAFRQAEVSGRCLGLHVLNICGEEGRRELLSYTKDGSKQVREVLEEILKTRREWEADVLLLLSSKKAAEREMAVRILLSWDEEGYRERLTPVWEKEKNAKVRALLGGLFEEGQSAAEEISLADLVKAMHKGGKKRSLAWAYTTPFCEVHRKDSQIAEEEYLQAILLSYASMGRPGVNEDAARLAAALKEEELAVYMGQLFDRWMEAGAEAKKRWVLYATAIHGGGAIIGRLQRQIQEWPAHSRGAIAAEAVCALALNPLPQALLIVDGIARKFKFRQVKTAAKAALEFAASQLGLSREELADKIVPDLGFDEKMQRVFDYGERKFTVRVTPALEMEISDENGKILKNMPAPGKRDDTEQAKAAYDSFKEMKKQMKATVTSQKARLELALSVGREWEVSAWRELFVRNPIMHQFAIGLIWGLYENHELRQSFRYMEDGSFNTEEEEEYMLPQTGRIGLVHPIELTEESRVVWKEQLEDYEITQPMEQVTRGIYRRTQEEAAGRSLERFGGILVNDLSLGGKLLAQGWYRGPVQDGGGFYTYYREDTEIGLGVELHFSGSFVGGENEEITVYDARFYPAGSIGRGSLGYEEADDKKACFLSEVPERYFSEIVLQLTRATASGRERDEDWRSKAGR